MRSRSPAVAGLLCLCLGISGSAAADVLTPTLGQPLSEVSHSVDVTIDRGVATYKVRRVFANAGSRADEAGLEIDLPPGAAATGLRIRARDRWYDGELMEAEKAARLYQELTGMGAHQAKDPALLQWMWADKLYLQVFPVLPGSTSTVEYTLTVPTRYEGGQVFLSYPRTAMPSAAAADGDADADADADATATAAGSALAIPILTVRPAWADATTRIVVDGRRVVADAPVVLAAPPVLPWLDALGPSSNASYAASELVIPAVAATKRTFTEVALTLDIDHTYKGDLRIQLMTPADAVVDVFGGDGGDKNDVKGTFKLKLPAATTGAGTWRLVVSDHAARDAGTMSEWSLALGGGKGAYTAKSTDTPVFLPDAPETANDGGLAPIVIAPPAIDTLVGRLGKVVASTAHAFSRLELDAAPQLAALPKKAQLVFVLDLSHSQGAAAIDAQLAIAEAYVSHLPDAQVELVGYRRAAKRVFDAFVPAADLPARIAAARKAGAFAPGNGSALDDGARIAVGALAKRKGALRIVLLTDELLRHAFTNKLALDQLERAPSGTIVHVVVPGLADSGEQTLRRDDAAPLAALAAAHHGILGRVDGLPAKTQKALADAVLGLVRPIRIDRFAVTGLDTYMNGEPDDTLDEGDSVRAMIKLDGKAAGKAPDKVVLTGKIWGDGFRKVIAVDAGFSRATAAFVFSEDEHHDLSRAEMLKVAFMGKAVSPVTSYLATEPGVRPSTIGIPGRGMTGSGMGGGAGYGLLGSAPRIKPDLLALLAPAVKACVAKHKPAAGWTVSATAESTKDEIVDVSTTSTTPIATCLIEAVWAVRLDSRFDQNWEQHDLTFR
jgi:subtilisin-like proprotein convertase family protein